MKRFVKDLQNNLERYPERVAVRDELGTTLTYKELDILSAKVAAQLNAKDIGREDFVCIDLPRIKELYAVLVGVIRAGAAYTILDPEIPKERADYISRTVDCRMVINEERLKEIRKLEPEFFWADADEHDALLAGFTSGTTGRPKGVIIEKGVTDFYLNSLKLDEQEEGLYPKWAEASPLNFMMTSVFMGILQAGGCINMLSKSTVIAPTEFRAFCEKHDVDSIFTLPSLYKLFSANMSATIKRVFVGAEPARDIPVPEGITLYNIYGSTEMGYVCAGFRSDGRQGYLPIGKPLIENKSVVVGDDSIIYAWAPFTRGYIGEPELTEENLREEYFRTGDVGRVDNNGDIICSGRIDDMIKINGNRIEPDEIAAVFLDITGAVDACAKGFSEGVSGYICIYYVGEEIKDKAAVHSEMLKRLPAYMIPAKLVRLNEIPRNANGKTDRNKLISPGRKGLGSVYAAPDTKMEYQLCAAFAKSLGTDIVGIDDDFFELGGSSLNVLEVVVEAGIEGLSGEYIYKFRTARKIAENVEANKIIADERIALDEEARKRSQALNYYHKYFIRELERHPDSTMINIPGIIAFDADRFDADRLVEAFEAAIRNHPSLLTVMHRNKEKRFQAYHPELFEDVRIENISEADWRKVRQSLVKPFKPYDELLFRARIFRTEKNVYLFFDACHIVFDGGSAGILVRDIIDAYYGRELDRDFYYLYLEDNKKAQSLPEYSKMREYLAQDMKFGDYDVFPTADSDTETRVAGEEYVPMDNLKDRIYAFAEKNEISLTGLFAFVTLFAISHYNGNPCTQITWLYNVRDSIELAHTIGPLIWETSISLELTENDRIIEKLHDVTDRIEQQKLYRVYEWDINDEMETAFIYQKNIFADSSILPDGAYFEKLTGLRKITDNRLNVSIIDDEEGFGLVAEYDAGCYLKASIDKFCKIFRDAAEIITDAAGDTPVGNLIRKTEG